MVRNSVVRPEGHKVDIPFTPAESARFRTFLKDTGRKAGPWVRTVVLAAMEAREAISPEAMETMSMFYQSGETMKTLKEGISPLEGKIHNNAYGIVGGVVVPVFIPASVFDPRCQAMPEAPRDTVPLSSPEGTQK